MIDSKIGLAAGFRLMFSKQSRYSTEFPANDNKSSAVFKPKAAFAKRVSHHHRIEH
jgi:hypothetical protein